ncbi:hypothetical protein [Streptomyces sp. P9-A2]|uniref:hypothetical protein n=1 Tax=Streptomyces sp. P9-A2 TaxID=3072284 RepID=UPI002FCCAE61
MDATPTPADALSEIQRVQQKAYAEQRLPAWYMPGVVALVTMAAVAGELGGTARIVLILVEVAGLAALTATLATRMRVRWRPRTWTVNAGVRMLLWLVSILVVWGIVPAITRSFTDSAVWQKVLAGAVAAVYAAVTTRWVENQVLAHSAGRPVR